MQTQTYMLNMGPQHPSTHGVLRVILELDGEVVVKATPDLGYLHRGIEKLAEARTYAQFTPYTDRLDYLSAMNNNLGYCMAVEKLAGIEVPERAQYLRVIMAELNRIASHQVFLGSIAVDLGGTTGLLYAFRDREYILDLFNIACGARMTFNYIRIGGVMADVGQDFIAAAGKFLDDFPKMLDEYHGLITGNEIFYHRLKGCAVISGQKALELGLTGPSLRASGVNFDLRKAEPYGIYDRFDFDVPLGENGDNWDRYLMRMREMEESAKIVRQALRDLPDGPVMGNVPKMLKPPAGEVYHRIENPRGELGYYIVSDGGTKPYRIHVRRPSFINLTALDELCRGGKIGDVVAVLATLDPILGEVDC
jgi:NADH-quinone oxidoreductase subunit D